MHHLKEMPSSSASALSTTTTLMPCALVEFAFVSSFPFLVFDYFSTAWHTQSVSVPSLCSSKFGHFQQVPRIGKFDSRRRSRILLKSLSWDQEVWIWTYRDRASISTQWMFVSYLRLWISPYIQPMEYKTAILRIYSIIWLEITLDKACYWVAHSYWTVSGKVSRWVRWKSRSSDISFCSPTGLHIGRWWSWRTLSWITDSFYTKQRTKPPESWDLPRSFYSLYRCSFWCRLSAYFQSLSLICPYSPDFIANSEFDFLSTQKDWALFSIYLRFYLNSWVPAQRCFSVCCNYLCYLCVPFPDLRAPFPPILRIQLDSASYSHPLPWWNVIHRIPKCRLSSLPLADLNSSPPRCLIFWIPGSTSTVSSYSLSLYWVSRPRALLEAL